MKDKIWNMKILYAESDETLEHIVQSSCEFPSLEVFKARLDGARGSLVYYQI